MDSLVLNEITFDGTALFAADGSLGSRFTKGAPGEPPMVRGEDDTVASLVGRVPYPRVADVLPIGITVWAQAMGTMSEAAALSAVEDVRQSLLALFTRTAAPRVMSAVLRNGSTATINCEVVPPVLVREVVTGLYYEFDVAFESVDPAWVITP